MSSIVASLYEMISAKHLLKHPFYVAWSAGQLSLEDLRHYSCQYFAHVRAFPAYLSEMHCRCVDLKSRQIIAGNLADEEATSPTHPELWLDFAAGLGVAPETVLSATAGPRMNALVETFRSVARKDTGLAVAGLYCYEKQIPAVSAAKISGLESNYRISDASTIRYFKVHETADVEHAGQWESLLARYPVDEGEAMQVAEEVLNALWASLDEIHEACRPAVTN